MENTVFWGLVTACLLAIWPTSLSPSLVKPTTDGVVRPPSAFGMTTGSPPSITATTELVVPRSIPITLSAILAPELFMLLSHARLRAICAPHFSAKTAHSLTHLPRACDIRRQNEARGK